MNRTAVQRERPSGRPVASLPTAATGRLSAGCPWCFGLGWLVLDEAGDASRDWVTPCAECSPQLPSVEAADRAALAAGCTWDWAAPAGTRLRRPYLVRDVPGSDLVTASDPTRDQLEIRTP